MMKNVVQNNNQDKNWWLINTKDEKVVQINNQDINRWLIN